MNHENKNSDSHDWGRVSSFHRNGGHCDVTGPPFNSIEPNILFDLKPSSHDIRDDPADSDLKCVDNSEQYQDNFDNSSKLRPIFNIY